MNKLLLMLLFASPSMADTSLIFGGFSYHVGMRSYTEKGIEKQFNETNETIGIGYNDFYVVYSKLSYSNDGLVVYRCFNFDSVSSDYIKAGVRLGAVYGYGNTPVDMDIAPLFEPIVKFNVNKDLSVDFGVLITHIPILTINAEYRL